MTSPDTRRAAGPSAETAKSAHNDLVRRYERIGISAVAGALACEKPAEKKEPAPAESWIKERELELTA